MIYSYRNDNLKIKEILGVTDVDKEIAELLKPVSLSYDKFNIWLNKVFNEVKNIDENISYRDIILNIQDKQIIGAMILKKTVKENKLCTVFINDTHRGKGFGKLFFFIADEILGGNIKLSVDINNLKFIYKLLVDFKYVKTGKINNELFFLKF